LGNIFISLKNLLSVVAKVLEVSEYQ